MKQGLEGDLAKSSRIKQQGAAVGEHHLHILLNAGEALALHSL